jgi:hypothetical protein
MATHHLAVAALLAAGLGMAAAPARADGPAPGWGDAEGIGSSAYGIAATFLSAGEATALSPAPLAAGGGSFRYDDKSVRGSLSETLAIASGGAEIATLAVTGGRLVAEAKSAGFGLDTIAPSADGSIGSLTATLQLYPPPPAPTSGPVPAPLLAIVASGLAWTATDSVVLPKTPTVTVSASATSITLTGSLLNGDTFNVTGPLSANESFDIPPASGGTVRITFDRQVTPGAITCAKSCGFTPHGIEVAVVAVHLDHVVIGGKTVSGEITIGAGGAHVNP